MSFRLKEATYKVRCREPACTFVSEFKVKENIMGVTEADVDTEAIKIAKNMAFIKHDALLGRKHQLTSPEIFKISSTYDRIGGLMADSVFAQRVQVPAAPGSLGRAFRKGDLIMRKNNDTSIVVEVLRGSVQNEGYPGLRYGPGGMIGSAAIFHQKTRPVHIVAADNNTAVAIHDIRELTHSNPSRARELLDRAIEESFRFMLHLEKTCASLEKKLRKSRPNRAGSKPGQKKASGKRPASSARKRATKPGATRRQTPKARAT